MMSTASNLVPTIAIVDYGMGNLRSVAQALTKAADHARVVITNDPQVVRSASRVVFPGQGAMPDCMAELKASGLETAVREAIASKPTMGLCVGMQMLFDHAEEGPTEGLHVFAGDVVRFKFDQLRSAAPLKVPHMGWNEVSIETGLGNAHPVFKGIRNGERFYHVHSYYCVPKDSSIVAARTNYGGSFVSAIAKDYVFCTQFHPEKSGPAGLQVFKNFSLWSP
jgi:imidazole glycerol-phosphate synthase subunit HisH